MAGLLARVGRGRAAGAQRARVSGVMGGEGTRRSKRKAGDASAACLQLAADQQLIQDVVRLVEVEDEVELTHIAKVAIEHLEVGRRPSERRGRASMGAE